MKITGFQYHVPDDPALPVEVAFGIVGDGGIEITMSGKRQQLTIDELLEMREAIDIAVARARRLQEVALEDVEDGLEPALKVAESVIEVGDAVGVIR